MTRPARDDRAGTTDEGTVGAMARNDAAERDATRPTGTGRRCAWAESGDAMRAYHDHEWGVPSRDDRHLYGMLVLEAAQAGLSWATVLNRREGYRRAFADFDPEAVAAFDDDRLEELRQDPGIIRNRLKIRAARTNARALLAVRDEFGSFADYLWGWVDGTPVVNRPATAADVPSTSDLARRLSRDLRARGFTFVGPTIVYAYLEAVGVVDDHVAGCPAARDAAAPLPVP